VSITTQLVDRRAGIVAGLPDGPRRCTGSSAARPAERALHALWRRVWRGELRPGGPEIAELGPPTILATWLMVGELVR